MSNKPVRPPHSAWFVLIWASVIALVVSLITYWVLQPQASSDPNPAPTQTPTQSASPNPTQTQTAQPDPTPEPIVLTKQHALLIQVRNDDEIAVNNAIAVAGGPIDSSITTVLPGLVVDVAGDKTTTLGASAKIDDTLASVDAITDLLGADIGGGLVLDPLALTGLVDSVGGIVVKVKAPLLITDAKNNVVDIIEPGLQTLNGVKATEYSLALGKGEVDRAARFTEVLNQIIFRLPGEPERMRQLLTSLGSLARSTVSTDDLVDVLTVLHEDTINGSKVNAMLPVDQTREDKVVTLNRPKAERQLRSTMPELLFAPGEAPRTRVLTVNATGKAAPAVAAHEQLLVAGDVYLDGGVTEPEAITMVQVQSSQDATLERGKQVAQALGLSPLAVVVNDQSNPRVDVTVILGKDFTPAE